jgi:IMP dehydrogenase
MTTVRDLMKAKGEKDTFSVAATDTVYHAIEVMADENIGAVLVTEGDRIVGICTERDYARKIALKGLDSRKTLVKDVMTEDMITVNPETTVEQCMALMTKYHIRHLPVEEGDKLVGIVSMRDVMEMLISSKQSRIEQLESYILGNDYGH